MTRSQIRQHWTEHPIGCPDRGAPYGERLDPGTMGTAGSSGGWVSAVGSLFQAMGGMKSGQSANAIGQAQGTELDSEAARLDQNAGQARAVAQRQAELDRKKTALLVSHGIAVAAAGGGGTDDPTVTKLISSISGEGAYRSAIDIYNGEAAARDMETNAGMRRNEADTARSTGAARERAATLGAYGALAQGGAGLYAKYGGGGPKAYNSTGSFTMGSLED